MKPIRVRKPPSAEGGASVEWLKIALAQTMEFAVQGMDLSHALAKALVQKGVLTQEEIDLALAPSEQAKEKLKQLLAQAVSSGTNLDS